MTAFLEPALSSAFRIVGPTAPARAAAAPAAPADLMNVRREGLPESPCCGFDWDMPADPVTRDGAEGWRDLPVSYSMPGRGTNQSARTPATLGFRNADSSN